MIDWTLVLLEDLAAPTRNSLVGGPFGSNLVSADYRSEGIPVIRGENVNFGRWIGGKFVFVSNQKALELAANTARANDIIFTQRGENHYRQVAMIHPDCEAEFIISQSQMKITIDRKKSYPLFVYYLFCASDQRNYLKSNAIQTGVPHTNLGILRKIPLKIPPMHEQQSIATFLGALDDKIELNCRMNETLEAMARAIFQDWFVDFGPTRAKLQGRPPYLAPDLWALFPDRLDAEGKPKGWSEVPLDQIAEFLNGLALQKFPGTSRDDLPVIKIAELRAGVATGSDRASRSIPPQYVVEDGDVLFSWSGSLLQRVWTGGRGALNQHLFKVTSKHWPKWLHYLWVDHHLPSFQATAASKATTMGHIQRHHLSEAMTIIGSPDVMTAADALIGPLFRRCIANSLEARTLVTTRDLILPRLMSGELRVKDAERAIEAAA